MGMSRVEPRALDRMGRWYGMPDVRMRMREPLPTYQATIVRMPPWGGPTDSIVDLTREHNAPMSMRDGAVTLRSWGFVATDAWGVFPDGRVIVVRGATYSPEIVEPDGRRRVAASVPFDAIAPSAKDKEGQLVASGSFMQGAVGRTRDGTTLSFKVDVVPPDEWQATRPPLLSDVVRIDSRNRAWVHVLDAQRAKGERFDLLDANGRLVDAVRLPKGTTLVAMGNGTWYGTREDADGLVFLQRFPLP
jgi:hypothetical protein